MNRYLTTRLYGGIHPTVVAAHIAQASATTPRHSARHLLRVAVLALFLLFAGACIGAAVQAAAHPAARSA